MESFRGPKTVSSDRFFSILQRTDRQNIFKASSHRHSSYYSTIDVDYYQIISTFLTSTAFFQSRAVQYQHLKFWEEVFARISVIRIFGFSSVLCFGHLLNRMWSSLTDLSATKIGNCLTSQGIQLWSTCSSGSTKLTMRRHNFP